MSRGARGAGLVLVTAALLALAGCGEPPPPRGVAEESIYGPPVLSDWIEIDGRWQVTYTDDDDRYGLLQPAIDSSRMRDENDDAPRDPAAATWVDLQTGESLWSRDDLGSLAFVAEGSIVAFVGEGADRTIQAVDTSNGETLWTVPESDLGQCSGWSLVGRREIAAEPAADDATSESESSDPADEDAETRSLAVLEAPESCGPGRRVLLAQLDPLTGETEPLLRGSGRLETAYAEGYLTVLTWSQKSARLEFFDTDTAEVATTVVLDIDTLTEGTTIEGWTELPEHGFVELTSAAREGIWVTVLWNDPDDDQTYDSLINEFIVRPDKDTATAATNSECTHPGDAESWWYTWNATVPVCATLGMGESVAYVTTGTGDDADTWQVPVIGDRPTWNLETCAPPDSDDDQDLFLVPADDALLVAYDLTSGDKLWTYGAGQPGATITTSSYGAADRLVALTEDADGVQRVAVLRACTGEVVDEREVSGAYTGGSDLPGSSAVVTVPLESTTLLAHYIHRGDPPTDPIRASRAPEDV